MEKQQKETSVNIINKHEERAAYFFYIPKHDELVICPFYKDSLVYTRDGNKEFTKIASKMENTLCYVLSMVFDDKTDRLFLTKCNFESEIWQRQSSGEYKLFQKLPEAHSIVHLPLTNTLVLGGDCTLEVYIMKGNEKYELVENTLGAPVYDIIGMCFDKQSSTLAVLILSIVRLFKLCGNGKLEFLGTIENQSGDRANSVAFL